MITLKHWQSVSIMVKDMLIHDYRVTNNDSISIEQSYKLSANQDLYTAFLIEAHKVAAKRDHYSARTIMEVLRHNSYASDDDPRYKINNDITPLMAKMSMLMFPSLNGLFKTRSKKVA